MNRNKEGNDCHLQFHQTHFLPNWISRQCCRTLVIFYSVRRITQQQRGSEKRHIRFVFSLFYVFKCTEALLLIFGNNKQNFTHTDNRWIEDREHKNKNVTKHWKKRQRDDWKNKQLTQKKPFAVFFVNPIIHWKIVVKQWGPFHFEYHKKRKRRTSAKQLEQIVSLRKKREKE